MGGRIEDHSHLFLERSPMSQPRFALTAFADVNTCAPDWKRTVADDEYAYLSLVAGRPDDSANSADPSDLQGAGNARTAEAPLRDLLRAVIGMTYTQDPDSADDTAGNTAGDSEGFKVLPADALRVMAVFRLLGAGALLTVADFCHHTGLDEHEVTAALNPPLRRAA